MTPEARHREAVLRRDRVCQGPGPHGGRLQAHHPVETARLRREIGWRRYKAAQGHHHPILDRPLDDLIADGRNGVALCELCHGRAESGALPFDALPEHIQHAVTEFAIDVGAYFDGRRWVIGDAESLHGKHRQAVGGSRVESDSARSDGWQEATTP